MRCLVLVVAVTLTAGGCGFAERPAKAGDPMPDVQVRTAYGSDRGRLVVPADWAVLDVLRFEGPGARDVEDVEVRVREAEELAIESPTEAPEIQRSSAA